MKTDQKTDQNAKPDQMKTYEVNIYEKLVHTVEVEATNPEEAYNKALNIYLTGTEEYDTDSQGIGSYDIEEVQS
jgi:hypothetical protein